MKPILTLLFSFVSLLSFGQGLDSIRFSKNSTSSGFYRNDTGTYLPKAVFVDENGNKKALADFKDKILYISIWATWCGNCITRFPYEEQLLKRLRHLKLDTSVVLININVDDTKSQWKHALKKYRPQGINLYSSDTSLYEKWNISALPAYSLIDRWGKVLGMKIYMPDEPEAIDWVLYNAVKGVSPPDAIRIKQEQSKLIAQQRSPAAITHKEYADWFAATMPLYLEFHKWRGERTPGKGH